MQNLPQKITVSNNPTRLGIAYMFAFMIIMCGISFSAEGYFDYPWLVGISSVILGILLFVLIYKLSKKHNKTIEISTEAITQIKGGKTTYIKWIEEHQTYYDGTQLTMLAVIPTGTVVKTQVVAKGRNINIEHAVNDFHNQIMTLSSLNVISRIKQQIEEGLTVHFGPIQLSKEYISLKRKKYLRSEITKLKVENGKVIIKVKGQWLPSKVLVRDIGNYLTLLQMIDKDII